MDTSPVFFSAMVREASEALPLPVLLTCKSQVHPSCRFMSRARLTWMDASPVFLSAMVRDASEALAAPVLRPDRAAVVVALQKVVTLTAVGSVVGSTGLVLHADLDLSM